jgi:type IV pilus assembly protein PilQ
VIDLSGPRAYEVVPSAKQVIVRVKTEDTAMAVPPVKATPSPASVPASAFAFANASAVAGQTNRGGSSVQKADIVNTAPASAPAKPQAGVAALPPASSTPRTQTPQAQTLQPKNPQIHDSVQKADVVNTAPSIASVKPKAEVAALPAVSSTPQPQAPQPQPQVRDEQAHGVQKAYVVSAVPDASARPQAAVTAVPAPSSNLVASSTPSNTPVASTPAANSTLIASAPVVHDQQMSDPRVRAGAAAETMATSPAVGQAPAEVARLNPQASGQVSGNAAPVAPAAQKYTGEPISVNLKDVDLKDFFRLIHEISGLNIVLDPNVRGTVTLVLDDVPWDQALDIVLKNNSLDRELQGNVLRIAATDTLRKEAVDRRAQSEAVALAVDRQTITRFLSYAKAKETVPTIKKFLTARGDIISDDRTNALIISDIPSVLPNIDHLISQLDRKSQEVEIEVRVVSATRSFSRDLGVQLGFNWGNGVSTIGGTNPNGASGGTTGPLSTIPLFTNLPAAGPTTGFSLSNITKNYGIDAILTAAETHNLAKVLSRPRIVTQSNVKAEVKQGVKIPVYTTPTGNTNSSVSYVDAVLRLSVLPQITADNTIFLTVDVENTQPAGTAAGGNYILTTQQATTQVLVTDGGTVVIGGVIQTTNSVSTSQTPILGNIPWLGNLFKERLVKTETDELIFFITPKIIQT